MATNCNECVYFDFDYEWDKNAEDEVVEKQCFKNHNILLNFPVKCPYCKKYTPSPYIEEDTKCDLCEYKAVCEKMGFIIDITTCDDSRKHFIVGRGCYCVKEILYTSDENKKQCCEENGNEA